MPYFKWNSFTTSRNNAHPWSTRSLAMTTFCNILDHCVGAISAALVVVEPVYLFLMLLAPLRHIPLLSLSPKAWGLVRVCVMSACDNTLPSICGDAVRDAR